MARIYSKCLVWCRLSITPGPAFVQVTVPDGKVWIVRDGDFCVRAPDQRYFQWNVIHVGPPVTGTSDLVEILGWIGDGLSIGATVPWRGRQVLTAGDILQVFVGSLIGGNAELDVSISGYELSAP